MRIDTDGILIVHAVDCHESTVDWLKVGPNLSDRQAMMQITTGSHVAFLAARLARVAAVLD